MRHLRYGLGAAGAVALASACSSGGGGGGTGASASSGNSSSASTASSSSSSGASLVCPDAGATPGIKHVVIVVQENHTFDNYFGTYCTAPTGSNPTCTDGPSCCEAAPDEDPTGASPVVLDDTENAAYDPNHTQACELTEIDDGKMDGYVTADAGGEGCQAPQNFAYAGSAAEPYRALATENALADRYFQSIAGQSSSNDMYLAVARQVFLDNADEPKFVGSQCSTTSNAVTLTGTTIADLLTQAGKTVAWYGGGFDAMKATNGSGCPPAPAACGLHLPVYPCVFEPGDVPFLYYSQWQEDPDFMRDYTTFATDVTSGTLPDVAYVKAIGYESEHPGYGDTVSAGTGFVQDIVSTIHDSCYATDTLILVTWDESGGFFDHVSPPASLPTTVDSQACGSSPDAGTCPVPYGPRIPLLAIGRFASKGTISHVPMEHASIVKFLEWNFLGGQTGQLQARDAVVNNLGSLLDPAEVGTTVPSN